MSKFKNKEEHMQNTNNILLKIKGFITVIGGIITSLLGGWDMTLKVLVAFVSIDYILGVLAAGVNSQLNSKTGFKGIFKKISLFIPIGMGFALDQLFDTNMLRNMTVMFYIASEGLSITENLAKMEAPLPQFLVDKLVQLQNENNKTEEVRK